MERKRVIRQLKELEKHGKDLRLAAEWSEEWQILISTILSARTRDEKTIEVSNRLYKRYGNLRELANADLNEVRGIIREINYHRTKAKHIIKCARLLVEKYDYEVPHDFWKLVDLPGVGRKTANVFLAVVGKPAIGVDTHVSNISRRLGWTKHKKVEKIEEDLKKLFPKRYWIMVNYILVRFGRTFRGKKREEILKKVNKIRPNNL